MDIKVDITYSTQSVSNMQVLATNYNRVSGFTGGAYTNSILQSKNDNYKRFILGKSILGGNNYYSGTYNGIWGNVASSDTLYDSTDVSKGYVINNDNNKYVVTITNESNIDYLKLVFDKNNNIFAKMIAVNGNIYYNNNIEFEVYGINSTTATIEILSLNDSNVPVLISSLSFDTKITYDKNKGLIEVTRGNQSMADNVLPEYNIVSQYGSLSFQDYNGIVYELITNNKLDRNLNVYIYKDDIVIGTYETTSDWNYNIFNNEVSVSLQDRILDWQETIVEKKNIDYNVSATQIYAYLLDFCKTFTFDVSRETLDFWDTIIVPYFYLESGSLWEQWNKFLTLTQSVLYVLPDGKIKIVRRK